MLSIKAGFTSVKKGVPCFDSVEILLLFQSVDLCG